MPKMAIVSEYFYPLLGGITENVYNSAQRLSRKGWDVKIITSRVNPKEAFIPYRSEPYEQPRFELIRLGKSIPVYSNGSWGRFTVGLDLVSKLKKILEDEKFDLIHIHSPLVPTLPFLSLLLTKNPAVGTFHTYFGGNIFYRLSKSRLQKDLNKLRRQIYVSQSCVTSLIRYFKLEPTILPNGVDTEEFSPEVPRLEKFGPDKLNLLFVGRFDPRNGLRLMIRAFSLIKASFKDVRLIVVGGPLRNRYRNIIPQEIKDDVFFEGPILSERPNYYVSADIFCSPVDKASFGITLLEAMASGKPVVATENVGYNELLQPEESIVVPRKSPEALANAILKVLRDDQLRKRMGEAGRKKALKYSWDKIVPELEKIYLDVLGSS